MDAKTALKTVFALAGGLFGGVVGGQAPQGTQVGYDVATKIIDSLQSSKPAKRKL